MVTMVLLSLIRTRYTCLLVHLTSGDIAGDIEDGRESSSRCSHGVVNLVQSMCATCLVSQDSNQFKDSTTTIGSRTSP
jgi:hypothetical protein